MHPHEFLGFALANADFCYVMERGAITIAGKPADLSEARLHEALAVQHMRMLGELRNLDFKASAVQDVITKPASGPTCGA